MDYWNNEPYYPEYLRDDLDDEEEIYCYNPICIYCEAPLETDEAILGICLKCRGLAL